MPTPFPMPGVAGVLAAVPVIFLTTPESAPVRVGVVRLSIEGQGAGTTVLLERAGGWWIPRETLQNIGLSAAGAEGATLDGTAYVSLESLAGVARFVLDESAAVLRIAPVPAMPTTVQRVAVFRLESAGKAAGEVLLVWKDGEPWIAAEVLEKMGIRATRSPSTGTDGVARVALSSVPDAAGVRLEEARGVLAIGPVPASAPPALVQAPAPIAGPVTGARELVALVQVVVDGLPRGEVVVVRIAGELWAPADAMARMGLRALDRRGMLEDTEHVGLRALPAGFTAELDLAQLVLRIDSGAAPAGGHAFVGLVTLEVNGRATGSVLALRRGGDVWVSEEALRKAGILQQGGTREVVDGAPLIALSSLPDTRFELDLTKATLALHTGGEAVAAAGRKAVFAITVNGQEKGDAFGLMSGDDVWLPLGALAEAGLRDVEGRQKTIDGEAHVSLSSLAPDVRHRLDTREMVLALTASARHFPVATLDLTPRRPDGMRYARDAGAFLNYAVHANGRAGARAAEPTYGGFAELGTSIAGTLFVNRIAADGAGDMRRLASTITLDDRERRTRWTVGDQSGATGRLGGSAPLGGIGFRREYALDPYRPRRPSFDLAAEAETPSTVEVYVDGRLVRTATVEPGRFEVENIVPDVGRGKAEVVVRDAFGREKRVSSGYHLTAALLAPGEHEFSYQVGLAPAPAAVPTPTPAVTWDANPRVPGAPLFDPDRAEPRPWLDGPDALALDRYRQPAAFGAHRVGVARWLTAGARVEATSSVLSGGTSFSSALPIGELELDTAASTSTPGSGLAARLGYGASLWRLGFGGSLGVTSRHYANASLPAETDRNRYEVRGFLRMLVGPGSISLDHQVSERYLAGPVQRTAMTAASRLTKRSSIHVIGIRQQNGTEPPAYSAFVGVTAYLGRATSLSANYGQQDSGAGGSVSLQKSSPAGTGLSYRVTTRGDRREGSDPTQSTQAGVQYQGDWGRYELAAVTNEEREPSGRAAVSGGLVFVRQGIYPTRPVEQGFALVRVPGVEGVRVYASNRPIGRTNSRGNLLVPNLLPYYANRLSIAAEDLPMDYRIDGVERLIAPASRGAAVVTFPVQRVQALTGKVRLTAGKRSGVPVYGDFLVRVNGVDHTSPIGRGGEFYFENVPPGRHPAEIQYRGRTCRFTLTVPDVPGESVVDLGSVGCAL